MFVSRLMSYLLLFVCMAGSGIELDESHYPERLQWYAMDDAFSHEQLIWQHGRYLRLHFDQLPPPEAAVWLHGEGGLFKALKPIVVDEQWLFERPSDNGADLILLKDFGDEYPTLIEYSKHDSAPLLKVSGEVLLHEDNQVTVHRTDGHQQFEYNRLFSGQLLVQEFEGPGRFDFVFRTPWQGEYGQATLMELAFAIDEQDWQSQLLKVQPAMDYELETPWCRCRYSRAYKVSLEIPEGEHKVRLNADREILGFWRTDAKDDAYLFDHNANLDFVVEPHSEVETAEPPRLNFYRSLMPQHDAEFETFSPKIMLDSHHQNRLDSHSDLKPNTPDSHSLFTIIRALAENVFPLPKYSLNAPLKVQLKPANITQSFSLVSDSGERVRMLARPSLEPQTQFVQFQQAYTEVRVENHSDSPLKIILGYKNLSRYRTDERNFIDWVDNQAAGHIIEYLSGRQSLQLTSVLLSEEVQDWAVRLQARRQSFETRFGGQSIAGDIDIISQKLGKLTGRQIDTLSQLQAVMTDNGLQQPFKRWLVARAMRPASSSQQQAQQLLLANLASQERWFDIEGYWAYRLHRFADVKSLMSLAKVLFNQNHFDMAAKWFWLLKQAEPQSPVPAQMPMAVHKAGFTAMSASLQVEKPTMRLPQSWRYWQKAEHMALNAAGGLLVHNTSLDSYFTTVKLRGHKPHPLNLSKAGRYKLTLYPYKDKNLQWSARDVLSVTLAGETRLYELAGLNDSMSLAPAVQTDDVVGSPKTIVFDLPPDVKTVTLQLSHHDALLSIARQHDLIDEWNTAQWKIAKGAVDIENARLPLTPYGEDVGQQQRLLDNKDYRWQRLQTVISSAGSKTLSFDTWQGLAGAGNLQQALLVNDVMPSQRLISAEGHEVFEFGLQHNQTLTFNMAENPRFGYPETIAKVVLEHNGDKTLLTLPVQKQLALKPGHHRIRLSLANEQGFYRGKPIEENRRAWVFYAVDGMKLPPIKRRYEVATAQQPLQVLIPAQSWVRIDNASGRSETAYYPRTTQLTLKPKAGKHEALYRLFHWQKTIEQPTLVTRVVSGVIATRAPKVTHWPLLPRRSAGFEDIYQRDEQSEGTWGLFAGYRARRNFDEQEQTVKEKFYQLGWSYRRNIPDWHSHFASDVSLRKHRQTQLQTLVMENFAVWQPNRYWDLSSTLNLYHQYRAPDANIDGAWSAYASTSATWKQFWQDDISNHLTFSLFARHLSLSENDVYPGHIEGVGNEIVEDGSAVDDDIYSDYKEDNPRGMRIGNTWQYAPYLDTRLRLSASVTSDKHFNIFSPRRASFGIGLRQYFEPAIIRLDYRHVRFKRDRADADTTAVLKRNSLRLGLTFEHWRPLGELGQVEFFANRNLADGETSFGIQFNWFISQGQGYDDFAPSRLAFSGLRKRMGYHHIKSNKVMVRDE